MPSSKQDVKTQRSDPEMQLSPVFTVSQSYSFEQAKSRWQKSWETVLKQCHDVFIRD